MGGEAAMEGKPEVVGEQGDQGAWYRFYADEKNDVDETWRRRRGTYYVSSDDHPTALPVKTTNHVRPGHA